MDERDALLESVANTIKTYRQGDLPPPDKEHVDRWLRQFTPGNQLSFLREFDHVIRQTYFTRENIIAFLSSLISNEKLVGDDAAKFWEKANVLKIQKKGQSQKEMVKLFAESLREKCNIHLNDCGSEDGPFIYLDDVLFTGGRVATDLEAWIAGDAPNTALVHVIVIALHSGGHYYISSKRLRKAISESGKNIRIKFWRCVVLENQKINKNNSDVLWPATIPDDHNVQDYIHSEKRYPLDFRSPGGRLGLFSSEEGRQLLESEFLIAGVRIRSLSSSLSDFYRPLGCSPFGVGFGSLIATYRNCPNNAPLAVWWGDREATSGSLNWYPLLERKTYSSAENIFGSIWD